MVTVLERPGRRCGATNRQGERCGNLALRGQRVCRFHGGKSPQAKTAAARREVERKAFDALARHKAVPVDNPLEAFRQLAGEVVAVKDWLGGIVEKIEEIRYSGGSGSGEQLRGELQAYTGLLDQCRRVLADYGRLNIDERLAGVTQAQARFIAEVTAFALRRIGLSADDVNTVRRMYVALLRMAGQSQAAGDGLRLPDDPDLTAAVHQLHARITTPDRTAALETELARTRSEVDALVGQRDDLLDALRRNRSGPPLAIEPVRPAEVVVERESITVPDPEPAAMSAPVEPHEVLPPAKSSRRGGMHFRSPQSSSPAREPDPWERYGYRSPGP